MDAFHYLLIILSGVLASAFFAGAETGLISLNRVRLRHEVERKNRRAIILNGFVENSERLLGTTLFGTNLANVLVGVYASALATLLFRTDNFWVEFGAAFVGSGLLLVFGEIVPKSLFRHYAHRLCMTIADALNAMAWLCAPVVLFVGFIMRVIVRLGGGSDAPKSFFVTREELKHLAKEGEVGGALTAEEREMIDGRSRARSRSRAMSLWRNSSCCRRRPASPGSPCERVRRSSGSSTCTKSCLKTPVGPARRRDNSCKSRNSWRRRSASIACCPFCARAVIPSALSSAPKANTSAS